MAKVLVTGSTGLLGTSLVPYLQERGHQVQRMGNIRIADLNADLTSFEQAALVLDHARPDLIINLAALTNVDRCETHPQEAYLLNVKTVENLCAWMKIADQACHLIHISTDQVYDGTGPNTENELNICNFYAMSKLASELVAGTVPSTILRTNFVGRSKCHGRASLTDWLFGALIDKTEVNVFDDVMFSPLSISTLCDCINHCIVNRTLGTFNLGSRNGMSKADFAFAFGGALGLEVTYLKRVSAKSNSALIARRPMDMRMNCGRFEAYMGASLPLLSEEIYRAADEYL
jgi:dTDP-4-dehydrorhamnose reductase